MSSFQLEDRTFILQAKLGSGKQGTTYLRPGFLVSKNYLPRKMSSFQLEDRTFILQAKLGSGQQGTTYLYTSGDKLYTVKITEVPSEAKLNLARREIRILRSLQTTCHINAYPCFDYELGLNPGHELFEHFGGESSPLAMVIYDFVRGISFRELVGEKGFKIEVANCFIEQILPTLIFLHEKEIAHRDIKLDNIIYNPDEEKFTLIDFGLACQGEECLVIGGTPRYILPSIVNQKKATLEQFKQSDLYAMGICLYWYINKAPPFTIHMKEGRYFNSVYHPFKVEAPAYLKDLTELLLFQSGLGAQVLYERYEKIKQ